ncbi:MAG: PQQ-dependent sugar dehydrogenase [Nitrososphaerota archaeon]
MSVNAVKNFELLVITITSILLISVIVVYAEPITINPKFVVEKIFTGHFEPSSMAFLSADDLIVLDRDEGKVFRITDGVQSQPLLDVNVATSGYRGLLGVAISTNQKNVPQVFLYFTEARIHDGDDATKNPLNPLGNRLYRYDLVDNKLVNPRLLLDLPAQPGPRHAGGKVAIGPDKNLYVTIGDLDGTFRFKQYETKAQNYWNGVTPDGRSGILVVSQDGKPVGKGILGAIFPLNLYYAYGIRNSFGIDWDPVSRYLWDSENGPTFGDELNLVLPGFNGGWANVQGFWKPNVENMGRVNLEPKDLVNFNGQGTYSPPKFVWLNPAAPSAVKFLNSDKYSPQYKDDLFVGDANNGYVYDFNLDQQRRNLNLSGKLSDKIANNTMELNDVIFAKGFGKVADMEIGPDGYLYVLSSQKQLVSIYRIGLR